MRFQSSFLTLFGSSTLLVLALADPARAQCPRSMGAPPARTGAGLPSVPRTPGSNGVAPASWQAWWELHRSRYTPALTSRPPGTRTAQHADFFLGQGSPIEGDWKVDAGTIRNRILPSLFDALDAGTEGEVAAGILIALAKLGDAAGPADRIAIEQRISARLDRAAPNLAEVATIALGILGQDSSARTLAQRLNPDGERTGSVRQRAFAAYSLGLTGMRTQKRELRQFVAHHLVRALAEENGTDVPVAAAIALGMMQTEPEHERLAAAHMDLPPSASLASLVHFLLNAFEDKGHALEVRAHTPRAVARLIGSSLSRGPALQRAEMLKQRAARSFLRTLSSPSSHDRRVVQGCILALGELGDADEDPLDVEIRERLKALVRTVASSEAKGFALISLAQIVGRSGSEGLPVLVDERLQSLLIKRLTRGREAVRPWAALSIGVLGHELSQRGVVPSPVLREALLSEMADPRNADQIEAYATALGILGDAGAKGLLFEEFQVNTDPRTRGAIAVALGLLGATDAIRPIRTLALQSLENPQLLRRCAIALSLLGDRRASPELAQRLATGGTLLNRANAVVALAEIGDRRAVDVLLELFESAPDPRTRAYAAMALGCAGDTRPAPWKAGISAGATPTAAPPTLYGAQPFGILNIP